MLGDTEYSEEKDRLDIIDKKLDIQRKRLNIRMEKLELKEFERRKLEVDEHKILVEKVDSLYWLLSGTIIDEEKTLLGSEPMLKCIVSAKEKGIIKQKLFEIIEKY